MPAQAEWRHNMVDVNGVELHVVDAGPQDGRLIVLLHGFPEFWYAWKDYVSPLAAAGYRVLVPDQRGYNLSAHPAGIASYTIETLAGDLVGLIDGAGCERAVVVGHDWGGYVGWWAAAKHPSRIDRLVAINIPHPRAMLRSVLTDPRQTIRSWYMFLLQVPWLPEWILSYNSFALLRWLLARDRDGGLISPTEEAAYVESWSRPQALTTMINWYRAAFRTLPATFGAGRVSVPALLIWGEGDRYLRRSLAKASMKYCDWGRVAYVPGATHWVHHERPDVVESLILGFLSEATSRATDDAAAN